MQYVKQLFKNLLKVTMHVLLHMEVQSLEKLTLYLEMIKGII